MPPRAKKRRVENLAPCRRINPARAFHFSFINNLWKNASSALYFKLIKSSKCFLAKEFPKLVKYCDIKNGKRDYVMNLIRFEKCGIQAKYICYNNEKADNQIIFTQMMSQVYHFNVRTIVLKNLTITLKEIKLLMGGEKFRDISLGKNVILNSNGNPAEFDDILALLPPQTFNFW